MIKLLRRRQVITGWLKIGITTQGRRQDGSAYSAPMKVDHFELTGVERDGRDNLVPDVDLIRQLMDAFARNGQPMPTCGGCERAKSLGFPEGLPRRIPVYFEHDDLEKVIPNELAIYKGRQRYCHGDGETAKRLLPVKGNPQHLEYQDFGPCGELCPDFSAGTCKAMGTLLFSVPGAPRVGSVFAFRTTSWNSLNNIVSSLEDIREIAGTIELVPLFLDMQQKTVVPRRGPNAGRPTKAWVVVPYFPGTRAQLLAATVKELEAVGAERGRLRLLTAEAAAMVTAEPDADTAAAIEAEFYAGDGGSAEGAGAEERPQPTPAAPPSLPSPAPTPQAAPPPPAQATAPHAPAAAAPEAPREIPAPAPAAAGASTRRPDPRELAKTATPEQMEAEAEALERSTSTRDLNRARRLRNEAAAKRAKLQGGVQQAAAQAETESGGSRSTVGNAPPPAAEAPPAQADVLDAGGAVVGTTPATSTPVPEQDEALRELGWTDGAPAPAPAAASQPAPDPEPTGPPEIASPKITDQHRRELIAFLRTKGLVMPAIVLQTLSDITGRPVTTTADLTVGEYEKILGFWTQGPAPAPGELF